MFRRYSVWLAVAAAGFAAALLTWAFSNLGFVLFLLGLIAGLSLAKAWLDRGTLATPLSRTNSHVPQNDKSTEDMFALGKLFEATMGGMREGLLVVDQDMRVVASNSAARRLFNSSLEKLDSHRVTELTRNPAIYSAFVGALQGKERSDVKVETYGPVRRIFDLRVVPLNSGHAGTTQGAIGVFFDITQLERLERVRQEFLSNVSHELRTPLTAILAFVETLESGVLEETGDNRRFLAIIRKNATRMHTLIDDILELSAIEAGNVKVQPKEFKLRWLVSEIMTSLAAKADSRGLMTKNSVDPDVVVFGDPSRVEQMLTNLIDNAIKFSREGGTVSVRYEEDNGRSRILVQDTGEGIPSHHLERLFERFYRIDRGRSRDLGGTGLGLAIVKHLAMAHGGDVKVESKLGEGSVFAVELPGRQSAPSETATTRSD